MAEQPINPEEGNQNQNPGQDPKNPLMTQLLQLLQKQSAALNQQQ